MEYSDTKGPKYGRWDVNQLLRSEDLNALASFSYQNLADVMASVVEGLVGDAVTGTKDILINGLKVSISGDNLEITAGSVISYQGSYFNPATGSFEFQDSTGGQPFLAVLPEISTIDDFVTSSVITGMEIRGNIEIRPEIELYREEQRAFIDPNTNVVSNSTINVRGSFGAETRLRYGVPQNSGSQAPNMEDGWVKIAELFIDNNGEQTIVSNENWTSGEDDFLVLLDQLDFFTVDDLPVASTSVRGIVERATDAEFGNDDTTRYASALQINNAIAAAVNAARTSLEDIINNLDLGIITLPVASTTVRGIVERATNTEFTNNDTTRYASSLQINNAITAAVAASRIAIETIINNLDLGIQLTDIPNASTSVRGLVERATNTEFNNRDGTRYVTAAQVRNAGDDLVDLAAPRGSVQMYAGIAAPAGWALCDGSERPRSEALFGIVGTRYGNGNGSTTFNVPDLQERFPLGPGGGRSVGDTGGSERVTLSANEMPSHRHNGPSHSHSIASHRHSTPSHSHSLSSHTHTYISPQLFEFLSYNPGGGASEHQAITRQENRATGAGGAGSTGSASGGNTGSAGGGSTGSGGTGQTSATGGGQDHENMPPFVVFNFIIKL